MKLLLLLFSFKMRRLKTPIGIVSGVVKQKLKVAIAQCSAGRIKEKLCRCRCGDFGGLIVFRIELQYVIAVSEFGRLDLL